ncbi:putative PEPTIDE SYNTHETASE NRP domain protein [Mycobacterium xenopi 3993]|nr:putative PEPTIDE SYNTHETASE NRP domain protein [Mycobacterium xenopi 3993]
MLVAEQVDVLNQTPSVVGVLSTKGLESTALVVAGKRARPRWWIGGRPDG